MVDNPSFTSNSESRAGRLPVAGLLVIVLLVILDHSVYRSETLWRAFHDRLASSSLLEQGLVLDRLALFEADRGGDEPSVFLVGSSRLNRGFRSGVVGAGTGAERAESGHPQHHRRREASEPPAGAHPNSVRKKAIVRSHARRAAASSYRVGDVSL